MQPGPGRSISPPRRYGRLNVCLASGAAWQPAAAWNLFQLLLPGRPHAQRSFGFRLLGRRLGRAGSCTQLGQGWRAVDWRSWSGLLFKRAKAEFAGNLRLILASAEAHAGAATSDSVRGRRVVNGQRDISSSKTGRRFYISADVYAQPRDRFVGVAVTSRRRHELLRPAVRQPEVVWQASSPCTWRVAVRQSRAWVSPQRSGHRNRWSLPENQKK